MAKTEAPTFFAHWRGVFVGAAKQWIADHAPTLGSSLAYYTLFSLVPLLLFAITIVGMVFGSEGARAGVLGELRQTIGTDVAKAIEAILQKAEEEGGSTITLFGVGLLLFGASGGFVELQDALNLIWKVPNAAGPGIRGFLRARLSSLIAVVGMGFLLLASLVLSSVISIAGRLGGPTTVWQFINAGVSLGLITLVLALVYRLLPDCEVHWSDVWGGAFTAALLFTLGKQLFSLFLSHASAASLYGSTVAVVLLWVYYSSMILLFGAEVAHEHAVRSKPLAPVNGPVHP